MATTDLVAVSQKTAMVKAEDRWTRDEIDLIKRTVAKGTTDDEFKLFLYQSARTGLDPLAKQIHAIKRWDSREQREVMAIQTGIDGYRLIADRTNSYAPGREPSFVEDGGKLVSATAYVKKLVAGAWHEVAATAFWDEYVQKTRDGKVIGLWSKMPHGQLAKCAEALALRRAFPAEMSGVHVREEMDQVGPVVDMDHATAEGDHVTAPEPVRVVAPHQPPAASSEPPFAPTIINDAELAQLNAAMEASGLPMEEWPGIVLRVAGVKSRAQVPVTKFRELLRAFQSVGVPEVSDAGPETAVVVDKHVSSAPKPAAAKPSSGSKPTCPGCGKADSVIVSKFKPGYFTCWKKARTPGCGREWMPGQSSPADERGAAEAAEIFTDGAR